MIAESKLKERIKIPEYIRASGDCVCKLCGKEYWRHSFDLNHFDWDGFPYLTVLCDGTLVKL